jgi:ABC-type phosphate/phosphonate transport system substrate-binding protein
MAFISNARMYAVCPEAEDAWRELISRVAQDAGAEFEYQAYPAPQPLENLWRRADIGCVQMCGYPIVLNIADVVPLASPIPAAAWANGQAVYRSDLIVRKDAPYETLADTFNGTAGWTVEHSQSGFNAFRHHLLPYRTDSRPNLYQNTVGNLVSAQRIVDSVLDGTIDIGPLDAYWHMLIKKYRPEVTDGIRILESTQTVPMPAFVAAPGLAADVVERMRQAFLEAHSQPWFEPIKDALLIDGFSRVTKESFQETLAWDREAKAANYPAPA